MSYSLLSPYEDPIFNSGVVRPFECLSGGWQLIKDQYFLYVGMCLVIVALPKKSCGGVIAERYRTASGSERDQDATFQPEIASLPNADSLSRSLSLAVL